ncbi:transcription factor bHLH120-like isoform X1 [Prunus avium]|uniref:Transcription factor bHLH120-like isoform X1 n=1 Tax=Prunus avium TaxID=42229 RepID=A0A6P5TIT0_PRUAV|nr:transcription factor bHLH120-like isoform X1 [Prunus avium]
MMFPLHQGKKLVFQTSSNPPQKHTISEDRILGHAISTGKSRRRKLVAAFNYDMIDQNSNDHNKKKKMMMHRENERQRRQEMGTLHASLRSLLPLEFIKQGKRSISDHMNEAVNYIKHLQSRIKRLDAKRAELKKCSNIISTTGTDHGATTGSSDGRSPSCLTVHPCCGGVQIVISCRGFRSTKDGLSLSFSISRVLEVLLEQGLAVVSCVSSKGNDRLLHTIQCEVNDLEGIDLSGLEQKLAELVSPYSSRCISE